MFEVSLSNLERNFELQNVKNIFEAPGRKIIGFLSVDGRVFFNINIANCDELSGIDSFSWSRDYNHLEECLGFRTYNSKLKCINEWSIQLSGEGGVVNQEGQWRLVEALTNIKDKYSDLSSNPSTCILQLNGDPVLLIQDVVVTLKLNSSSSVDITRSFQVKEFLSKDSIADSIVQKDFLFILEESGIISIYSLTQSRHIAVVKLIDYWKLVYQGIGVLSQSCKATYLAISSNLQHLLIYFTGTKFALHHVYLDDYFQHFPNHIHSIEEVASFIPEKDADEDDFDFYRKSKSTSRGWKSQVERLNSKLQVKGEIKGVGTSPLCNTSHHWFYTSKCNYKDEFSTPLKEKDVKISGFNKKIFQRQTSDRQDNSIRRSRHSSSSSQDSDSIPNKDSRHGSFILKIPKACRHSELRKLSAAIETTMLWFKGKGHGMMLLVDLQTNIQQCISFSEPTFVSTPCLDGQSPLLITSNTISAIAVGVDQEYLINKVMTYESATLAERLCQSNNWAHCSIPIHALEVGLKHRQLDTIAFFLKCREGVFSQVVESEQSINTDTEELWDALGLLLASIRENMSESQSKQYSDQLVHLTLTFVNRLIQNTWDTQKALEMDENMIDRVHDIKATSQKLMRYTCDLRGFLKDSPSWCTRTKSDVLPQTDKEFKGYYWCKDQTECEELNNFKTMSKKDVVESAILESCLPLAQAYLYQTMDQQVVMETDASSNSSADKHSDNESVTTSNSMNELIQIGRSMVIRSLINGDLNKASRILSNMYNSDHVDTPFV
ncbi:spatacsin-like [Antedon mediterranea]|uniref:spatacsin-like n=1 Tax=Antedon mediterranea TaxID=105859 RepID=UPI003AF8EA13